MLELLEMDMADDPPQPLGFKRIVLFAPAMAENEVEKTVLEGVPVRIHGRNPPPITEWMQRYPTTFLAG